MKFAALALAGLFAVLSMPSFAQSKTVEKECQDGMIAYQPEASNWDDAATTYGMLAAHGMQSCAIKKKLNLVSTKDLHYAIQILEQKSLPNRGLEIRYSVRSWLKGAFKGEFVCTVKSEIKAVPGPDTVSGPGGITLIAEPEYKTTVSDPVCKQQN